MDEVMPLVIAIDGPAAAGKSTTSRELARRLGLGLIDSGALFRTVTLVAIEKGVSPEQVEELVAIARYVSHNLELLLSGDAPLRVFLDGRDISSEIRTPEVGEVVSAVSAVQGVRDQMYALQHNLLHPPGAVVEGRDIGTKVFPEAPLKIFLEASVEERARRRSMEMARGGMDVDEGVVGEKLEQRDAHDSARLHSPLAVAKDAVRLDTTGLSVDEVVERIIAEARARSLLPIDR